MGPSPRRLAHFMAAALPKVPVRALKPGDGISSTGAARGQATGCRHAHSSSAMAPLVRFGEVVQPRALFCRVKTRAREPSSLRAPRHFISFVFLNARDFPRMQKEAKHKNHLQISALRKTFKSVVVPFDILTSIFVTGFRQSAPAS